MSINIRPVLRRTRGTTLSVIWNIDSDTDGEVTAQTSMRSEVKPINSAQDRPPGDDTTASAAFDLTYVAASGDNDAYIQGELTPAETASLTARYYVTDLRLTLSNGEVVQTDPATIDLKERVTEPAT